MEHRDEDQSKSSDSGDTAERMQELITSLSERFMSGEGRLMHWPHVVLENAIAAGLRLWNSIPIQSPSSIRLHSVPVDIKSLTMLLPLVKSQMPGSARSSLFIAVVIVPIVCWFWGHSWLWMCCHLGL